MYDFLLSRFDKAGVPLPHYNRIRGYAVNGSIG